MSLPSLVDVARFWTWVGQDQSTPAESAQVDAWLDAASSLVRAASGRTFVDEAAALTAVPAELEVVVVQAVERKWRNPAGVIQDVSGPFSARYAEDVSKGIYLTDDERAICRRYGKTSGLGVISTTRSPIDADVYVEVVDGAPIAAGPLW